MTKNQTIQIERVGNGFIVRPGYDPASCGMMISTSDTLVFQQLSGESKQQTLLGFINAHFTDDSDNQIQSQ